MEILATYLNSIRVIIVGITGSGKSSVTCSLANKELKVGIGKGNRVILVGEGIQAGGKSVTRKPSISIDREKGVILIDCPGFEDTEGCIQEIIISFYMDCLFKKLNNIPNKFKIMLVVQVSDLESQRGSGVLSNIIRLKKMFTNHEQLRKGICFVITKSDPEYSPADDIDQIDDNSDDEIK